MHSGNSMYRLCLSRRGRCTTWQSFPLHMMEGQLGYIRLLYVYLCGKMYECASRAEEEPPLLLRDLSFYGNTEDLYCGGGYHSVFTFRRPTISAMKPKPTFCGLSLIQAAQMTPCSWTKSNNFPSDMPEETPSVPPYPAVKESFLKDYYMGFSDIFGLEEILQVD